MTESSKKAPISRLTKKLDSGEGHYVGSDDCYSLWTTPESFAGPAIDKLAQYEAIAPVPECIEDLLDDSYDTGYQSCLNGRGMKWDDAEELQRYRELGTIATLKKMSRHEPKPEKTLWVAKLNDRALIVQASTSKEARQLAHKAFGTFGAQIYPLWKGRTHVVGVFEV